MSSTTNKKMMTEPSSCSPQPCSASAYSESSSLPSIIVFDLDDCLWKPEMHELSGLPSIPVDGPLDPNDPKSARGTVGMKVPLRDIDWTGHSDDEEIVVLYPGARRVLRELAMNPMYTNVQLAVASTSLEPTFSMACIDGLEIVNGVHLRSMLTYIQVGREGKLSTRKTSHFQLIQEESGGVPYAEMLFFDDCNWADHVGDLNREFGVVGVRTPRGLTLEEFHHGLEKFRLERGVDAKSNGSLERH